MVGVLLCDAVSFYIGLDGMLECILGRPCWLLALCDGMELNDTRLVLWMVGVFFGQGWNSA